MSQTSARIAEDRRTSRLWLLAFATAAVVAVAVLLYFGRDSTFWGDEWIFINDRLAWDADAFLSPHWEHPVLGMALLWKPLLATVGLHSYLPYLAVLLLLHVIAAAAVYRLVRHQAGSPLAFATAVVFLLLGTAGEVLLYAMPTNLVGSTAAGAWALALFLERPGRPGRRGEWAIALLLLAAIGTSGAGLFFIAALGAVMLIAPGRRRELWTLVPAIAAYGVWLLTFGRGSLGGGHDLVTNASLVPDYVREGVAHAVGAVSGLGDEVGLILAVLLLVATLWHLVGRQPILEGAVAGVAGLIAQFGLTGLARAQSDIDAGVAQADASRYVYIAAVFLFAAGAAWLGRRPPIVLREARVVLPLVALTGFALAANMVALASWHTFFRTQGQEVRAAITVLTRFGGTPAIPGDRVAAVPAGSFLWTLPSPDRLREIIAQLGLPLDDVMVPGAPIVPDSVTQQVLLDYVMPTFVVAPADAIPADTTPPAIRAAAGATLTQDGGCASIAATGHDRQVVLDLAGGATLYVLPAAAGTAQVALSTDGTFTDRATRAVTLTAGQPASVTIPDVGPDVTWQVRLQLPGTGRTRLCSQ